MDKTDAAIQHREVSSGTIHRNSSVIRNLDFNHLESIEKDLDYYEKVSDNLFQIYHIELTSLWCTATGVIDVFALRS